jgi:Flp pilus assembly pilin Flp
MSVRACLKDRSGAAAVEFAAVAAVFITMVFGVFEYAFVMLSGGLLESAVLSASRFGITGATTEGISRENLIRDIIEERTLGLIDMSQLTIDTKVYQSFDQIGMAEPFEDKNHDGVRQNGESFTDVNGNGIWDSDMGLAGLGGPGDIVLYSVTYQGTALTGFFKPILGDVTYRAAVAVRNEPFGE